MPAHNLTSCVPQVKINVSRAKGCDVNYCLQLHKTTFNQHFLFSLSIFVRGANTQHLCNSCIELSGPSFSQPLQLLHCHFPMASYFTIPKLIGFVHMSETQCIQRRTYTHTHIRFPLKNVRVGTCLSTQMELTGARALRIEAHHGANEQQSAGKKSPIEFPLQHQITFHMLYANHY